MRILANHGGDKRFAFLRGRWASAWNAARARVQVQKTREEKEAAGKMGLGGLADYGDSDEESNATNEESGQEGLRLETRATPVEEGLRPGAPSSLVDVEVEPEEGENDDDDGVDAAVKAARKWRAKEWAEMRRKRVAVGL